MASQACIIQSEEIAAFHHEHGHALGWPIEQSARHWIGHYAANWRAWFNHLGYAPTREIYEQPAPSNQQQ